MAKLAQFVQTHKVRELSLRMESLERQKLDVETTLREEQKQSGMETEKLRERFKAEYSRVREEGGAVERVEGHLLPSAREV